VGGSVRSLPIDLVRDDWTRPVASRIASNPRPSTSGQCTKAQSPKPEGPWQYRSPAVCRALSLLSRSGGHPESARATDGTPLASRGFPGVLVLEVTIVRRLAKDARGHRQLIRTLFEAIVSQFSGDGQRIWVSGRDALKHPPRMIVPIARELVLGQGQHVATANVGHHLGALPSQFDIASSLSGNCRDQLAEAKRGRAQADHLGLTGRKYQQAAKR
jgi:hypothetical protein